MLSRITSEYLPSIMGKGKLLLFCGKGEQVIPIFYWYKIIDLGSPGGF